MSVIKAISSDDLEEVHMNVRPNKAKEISELFEGCDNGEVLATTAAFLAFVLNNVFPDQDQRLEEAALYAGFLFMLCDDTPQETSH